MKQVISVDTMRQLDAYTIKTKCQSLELMSKAGSACFKKIKSFVKIDLNKKKVLIVCGKGNNAGDGYVIANEFLKIKNAPDILLLSNEFSKDGEYYFNKIKNKIKILHTDNNINFSKYDIIIDCIFGTGFKGNVKEPFRKIINKINDEKNKNTKVISIDINSGLNGDTGLCDIAVISDLTISIGYIKSGHLLNKAKDYIKKLENVDIGIISPKQCDYLIEKKDVEKSFKKRYNYSNKGIYGYIALIGGCDKYIGAIKLANYALSSLKSGVGVVKLATSKELSIAMQKCVVESTLFPLSSKNGNIVFNKKEAKELISNVKTVCIGMGIGVSIEINKYIQFLLNNFEGNLILDADALNTISKMDLNLLNKTKSKVVLTPHIKEFQNLINNSNCIKNTFHKNKFSISDIENNLLPYSKEFAKNYNLILLLKGPTTIVTNGNKTYLVNTGCPGMATAGSGDVLSGIIAGRIYAETDDTLLNVASSAYINGKAGEEAEKKYSSVSMISSDTVNCLPKVIKSFY